MSCISLGVDVGNFDTKSSLSSTPSGYSEYHEVPFQVDEYLKFNGTYYVPETERFPYERNKTRDEHAFILSLFAISKELLKRTELKIEKQRANVAKEQNGAVKVPSIQQELDNYTHINLGVGLPPTHCSTLSEPTRKYYKERFGNNGISFEYTTGKKTYLYQLCLAKINCYPQDFAAILVYNPSNPDCIKKNFDTYYAIDIGGYTVDLVTIEDGKLSASMCDSKHLGVLSMYDNIVRQLDIETGLRLKRNQVESIIAGKGCLLDDSVKDFIHKKTQEWVNTIINELKQFKVQFDTYPVIFVGGGALLLRNYIKATGQIKKCEFIENPNANAEAYRALISSGR